MLFQLNEFNNIVKGMNEVKGNYKFKMDFTPGKKEVTL